MRTSYERTNDRHTAIEHDDPLTDEELTALALADDPDAILDDPEAEPVSWSVLQLPSGLPGWYMPPVMARRGGPWRLPVVLVVVSAFVLIDALGLCNTYGVLSWA